MPAGGDLRLYKGRRDWGTEGDAQRSMYDLCRDSGMSHDQASRNAELGARQLARKNGETDGGVPASIVERAVVPRRLKTPWWGPFAGRLCVELPDGTLSPVDT